MVRENRGQATEELESLNRIVTAYLEFAEIQARRHKPMHMAEWTTKLDDFLRLADHDILTHAGRISHELAAQHATDAYDAFHKQRLAERASQPDDFDKAMSALPAKKQPRKMKAGPK